MENQSLQITLTLPSDLRIGDKAKHVLALKFEHPEWSQGQIGEIAGVSQRRVSAILNHPRILAAMPLIARQRVSGMVPKAVKAFEELIDQKENLAVREKVTTRVLADQKVLDAPQIVVKHDITVKPTKELEEMLRAAAPDLPPSAIEAQYTEQSDEPTTQE